jgi:hypothetical protein
MSSQVSDFRATVALLFSIMVVRNLIGNIVLTYSYILGPHINLVYILDSSSVALLV